jgi:hypothetical protein
MVAMPLSDRACLTQLASGLVSKVRTVGSDLKVKIFTKKLLVLDYFGPAMVLSLGHCHVKRDTEYLTGSCINGCRISV